MKEPEIVDATQAQIDELLVLAKTTFPPEQYKLLEGVLATFVYVMRKLQNAKTSIKRLRGMLFGHSTEHKRNLLGSAVASPDAQGSIAAGLTVPASDTQTQAAKKPRPPGQGRNAASDYSGAATVQCNHSELQSGDLCPNCDEGRVYDSPPKLLVKVIGQPPPWRHSL